jgi:hypothetical protein
VYFRAGYFKAGFWAAQFFGAVGAVSALPFDPWAPFPGDRPFPPKEKKAGKKRRHRHPLRIPRALRPLVELPGPLIPPLPLEVPAGPELVPPPWVEAPAGPEAPVEAPAMAQRELPAKELEVHWTEYAHLPYTAEEELEDLYLILGATLKR